MCSFEFYLVSEYRDNLKYFLLGGLVAAAAQESQRNLYITACFSFYAGLVLQKVRLTNNLEEKISRSDVLKSCNFNLLEWR